MWFGNVRTLEPGRSASVCKTLRKGRKPGGCPGPRRPPTAPWSCVLPAGVSRSGRCRSTSNR